MTILCPGPNVLSWGDDSSLGGAVFTLRRKRADYRAEWLTYLDIQKGCQPSSLRIYGRELELLGQFAEKPLESLNYEDLKAYVHARGGMPSTVGRRISALRSFYQYLIRVDVRTDDPTHKLDRPKIAQRLPRPVKNADELFLELDPIAQLIAIFLRETGLRIAEACSVDIPVPAPKMIRIIGKGNKERPVPLNAAARAAIDHLGGSLTLRSWTIQRRFRRLKFSPHMLRHTFATEKADDGVELGVLQTLLGHASPATTRVYVEYNERRLLEAVERPRA